MDNLPLIQIVNEEFNLFKLAMGRLAETDFDNYDADAVRHDLLRIIWDTRSARAAAEAIHAILGCNK